TRVFLGLPPSPPSPISVSPSTGTIAAAVTQSFVATLSDADGATDIRKLYLLLNTSVSEANGCVIEIDRTSNSVRLLDDAGTTWVEGSGTISNSRCAVNAAGVSVALTASTVAATIPVMLLGSFSTPLNAYIRGIDGAGNDSGYQPQATYTVASVPAANPILGSLDPSN